MKVKILKSSMNSYWYSNDVNKEFNVHYNITDRSDPFRHCITTHFIRNEDSVITELPEEFCVNRCDYKKKWEKYIKWLNKKYYCVITRDYEGYPYYGKKNVRDSIGQFTPFGTEIHIDDMIKHIDYMESQQHIKGGEQFSKESQLTVKMEKQKLSRQGLKEIHSVACSSWKETLEQFGRRNPLEDYIELSQEEINIMFDACTKEQLPIVSKYLKKDDGSVNVSNFSGDIRNGDKDIIRIRKYEEYTDKGFWLSNDYDWEIKTDSDSELCLIPTKKK